MRTKYHDGDVYVFPKGKEYIAQYEIVEKDNIRDLKTAVVKLLNQGFLVEGGMTSYKVDKWDEIWKKTKTVRMYYQTLSLSVVERKTPKLKEGEEKPKTIVKD